MVISSVASESKRRRVPFGWIHLYIFDVLRRGSRSADQLGISPAHPRSSSIHFGCDVKTAQIFVCVSLGGAEQIFQTAAESEIFDVIAPPKMYHRAALAFSPSNSVKSMPEDVLWFHVFAQPNGCQMYLSGGQNADQRQLWWCQHLRWASTSAWWHSEAALQETGKSAKISRAPAGKHAGVFHLELRHMYGPWRYRHLVVTH